VPFDVVMVTESEVWWREEILVLKRKFTLGYAEAAVYRISQRSPLMISISDVKPIIRSSASSYIRHTPARLRLTYITLLVTYIKSRKRLIVLIHKCKTLLSSTFFSD